MVKLPRRVPWSCKAEIEQLCSWIYSEDAGNDGRRRAMARLSAWHVATPLPHALDSVLSLLAAEIGDDSGSPALLVRQSYASAIVRFVNGMVDPLQFGAYARSIAAIAAQIGLPGWLVELRHAATHEDLPSLEILREAAREALVWLLHNYFLPVLASSETNARLPVQPSPLAPLLKEYKALAKQAARDESKRAPLQLEFTRIFRQLERWIGEAKVATSNLATGAEDAETKETLALELLSNALLDKGGLVPLAKKKRQLAEGRMSPPNSSLWRPLLCQVQEQHPLFGAALLSSIANRIGGGDEEQDASTIACLLAWVSWIVDTWGDAAGCGAQDTISQLLLNVQPDAMSRHSGLFAQLVNTLFVDDDALKARVLAFLRPADKKDQLWRASDVDIMKQRLDALQQHVSNTFASTNEPGITLNGADDTVTPAPGWRLLATSNWKPCPIGVSGSY